VFAAYVIKLSLKLQESGNLDIKNAVGSLATVYIKIPAKRATYGKVTLTVQERFLELEAVTDCAEELKTGETVQITGILGNSTLIVRPVTAESYERKPAVLKKK